MTREEAIRILDPKTAGEALSEIKYYKGFNGKTAAALAVSDACVLAVAALQNHPVWISVAERLPQNYVSVLVYLPGESPFPTVHEAYIGEDGEWHSAVVYGVEDADVTHWMPLPKPPKEDA